MGSTVSHLCVESCAVPTDPGVGSVHEEWLNRRQPLPGLEWLLSLPSVRRWTYGALQSWRLPHAPLPSAPACLLHIIGPFAAAPDRLFSAAASTAAYDRRHRFAADYPRYPDTQSI